jgi:hypothetical protein
MSLVILFISYVGSWRGNPRERDHWGDIDVDVWIILGRISRRWDVVYGLDWAGLASQEGLCTME